MLDYLGFFTTEKYGGNLYSVVPGGNTIFRGCLRSLIASSLSCASIMEWQYCEIFFPSILL